MVEILKAIRPQLIMLALIYVMILAVIFLDLWAGIRKAKARGEYRSSYGLRKTVDKISKYFNMIFVVTAIDAVQMLAVYMLNQQAQYNLPLIPIFTFVGAIFVGFIELKSIYENSEAKDKAKINEVAKLAGQIVKDHDTQDVVAALIEYLKDKEPAKEGGANG
jgi:predicted secreted protein